MSIDKVSGANIHSVPFIIIQIASYIDIHVIKQQLADALVVAQLSPSPCPFFVFNKKIVFRLTLFYFFERQVTTKNWRTVSIFLRVCTTCSREQQMAKHWRRL